MSMHKFLKMVGIQVSVVLTLANCTHMYRTPVQRLGLGTILNEEEIKGWDIDVRGDGDGLPIGSGSVAQGKKIYEAQCISCHGPGGKKGIAPELAGGQGTLRNKTPIKTVGSFWPYAPTLYDYINRAMPFDKPQSLTHDEVYAVTAYTLYLNDLVGPEAVLDAAALKRVKMPNRNGFIPDPRPDQK